MSRKHRPGGVSMSDSMSLADLMKGLGDRWAEARKIADRVTDRSGQWPPIARRALGVDQHGRAFELEIGLNGTIRAAHPVSQFALGKGENGQPVIDIERPSEG